MSGFFKHFKLKSFNSLNTKILFRIATALSILSLIASIFIISLSGIENAGPSLILFLVSLGISFQGYDHLKGFSYSTMIFAVVTTALYYPANFTEINGFKLITLIPPLIQVIMFGMGTSMSAKDFISVAKEPKAVFIGITAHFIIMPLLGFTLANVSGFSPEISAGIILVGCSPSGLASNVMNYLAKANLALSITITAIATLMSPFTTPLLMKLLAGTFIEIDIYKMMWDIFKMIMIPIGAGLLFNKLLHGKSQWLDKAMPYVSMLGIAGVIAFVTAAGRESLLNIGLILIGLVFIHNTLGYFIGYWSARILKLSERDSRTVAIEVGMQNAGLASGIAKEMGKIATVGLASAVFGPLMNITGSILASYWHRRPPKENEK
jgi:BASS family bile acid:Na+ symporter